jgi:hypothetical protein
MTKVVYNACYGGFSLSKEAVQRYWEIKGQQVWIEDDKEYPSFAIWTVWLTPPEERPVRKKNWESLSMDERIAYNRAESEQTWYDRNVDRHDPVLVQVVEELGDKANGRCAKLRIAEVSGPYRIDEYDGSESVETPTSYDWITP